MLGRLPCLVLSKIVGLGSSKRNWKELKRAKTPAKNQLKTDKLEKLTTLVGHHYGAKSERRRARLARADKLWTEDDFETLNLKKFGIDTSALSGKTKPNRSSEHGGRYGSYLRLRRGKRSTLFMHRGHWESR